MRRLLTALALSLALSLALVVPVAGSAAAATGGCLVGPAGVPQKAYDVATYVRSHNGAPPAGYVGGTTFQNREGNLDPGYGPFKEYDVNRHVTGVNRGPERIVLGPTRAASFYTSDHYTTFITMYGNSCTAP